MAENSRVGNLKSGCVVAIYAVLALCALQFLLFLLWFAWPTTYEGGLGSEISADIPLFRDHYQRKLDALREHLLASGFRLKPDHVPGSVAPHTRSGSSTALEEFYEDERGDGVLLRQYSGAGGTGYDGAVVVRGSRWSVERRCEDLVDELLRCFSAHDETNPPPWD